MGQELVEVPFDDGREEWDWSELYSIDDAYSGHSMKGDARKAKLYQLGDALGIWFSTCLVFILRSVASRSSKWGSTEDDGRVTEIIGMRPKSMLYL